MLLHIDGSRHRWFQDERWYELLVIPDDPGSEIYDAQLMEEESTRSVLRAPREVIKEGPLCALYSDRGQPLPLSRRRRGTGRQEPADAGGAGDEASRPTDDAGVFAADAQPPGTQLRNMAGAAAAGTAAGGITTPDEANRFLRERYVGEFNAGFTAKAARRGTGSRRSSRSDQDPIFSMPTERVARRSPPKYLLM